VTPGNPGGVRGWVGHIVRTASSILEGLAVTLSWAFRRPYTIQYPDKVEVPVPETLPEAYRGILEVDLRLCTGCLQCEKTCPIQCISISIEKGEDAVRRLTRFDIDISRCMYCGLCSESCAFDALAHSNQFEAARQDISELTLHFVREPVPVARHKAGEAPPRRPRGEILREVLPGLGPVMSPPARDRRAGQGDPSSGEGKP